MPGFDAASAIHDISRETVVSVAIVANTAENKESTEKSTGSERLAENESGGEVYLLTSSNSILSPSTTFSSTLPNLVKGHLDKNIKAAERNETFDDVRTGMSISLSSLCRGK